MAFLGWLLGIFKVAFGFAVGWIKGGRVFIVTAVALYVGFVGWAVAQLWGSIDFVVSCLGSFKEGITAFMEYLKGNDWFNFIYYCFALDDLLANVFSQVSVFVVFLAFSFISSIIAGMAVFAPLMIWLISSKLLTSSTGGLIRT